VVINGPVATAGFILYLFNNKGIKVPTVAEKIITTNKETEIVTETFKKSFIAKLYKSKIQESEKPVNNAIEISFQRLFGRIQIK